ncbi:MAG: acetyltransferase [Cytophagia bacterium]|nr:acetyltransferase [Cytophagia bacterium]
MPKLLIFGNQQIAEIALYYFSTDSNYKVEAFIVDKEYLDRDYIEGIPVYPLEDVVSKFSPQDYDFFIAVGYSQMNKLREQTFTRIKSLGYKLATYISSKCTWLSQNPPGENCFILENNTIQPFSKIGDNVTLWSGNHLGHHSVVEDHCFISSHVVISGNVTLGHNSFLGVNATVIDGIQIAPYTLLGAGVTITKHTEKHKVYVPQGFSVLDKKSDYFL